MFRFLYPYEYADDVFCIDYEKLYSLGYRALIFDIDNTLVHHGDDSTDEVDSLFVRLHNIGFSTLLLSNNNKARIERFMKNIDTQYVDDAYKPKKSGYIKALSMLSVKKEQAIFIGDQIFTDIYGANRCKIPSILVRFIRLPNETNFGKRRKLENFILNCYKKSKHQHRFGDIIVSEAK